MISACLTKRLTVRMERYFRPRRESPRPAAADPSPSANPTAASTKSSGRPQDRPCPPAIRSSNSPSGRSDGQSPRRGWSGASAPVLRLLAHPFVHLAGAAARVVNSSISDATFAAADPQRVQDRLAQIQVPDSLRGPVGGQFRAWDSPHFLAIRLEKSVEPLAETVADPILKTPLGARWASLGGGNSAPPRSSTTPPSSTGRSAASAGNGTAFRDSKFASAAVSRGVHRPVSLATAGSPRRSW